MNSTHTARLASKIKRSKGCVASVVRVSKQRDSKRASSKCPIGRRAQVLCNAQEGLVKKAHKCLPRKFLVLLCHTWPQRSKTRRLLVDWRRPDSTFGPACHIAPTASRTPQGRGIPCERLSLIHISEPTRPRLI
eukprot:2023635-Amphidinium_carterae.1